MWKMIAIFLLLSASVHAEGSRPEVSWVVDQDGVLVIAQVLADSPKRHGFTWRLISTAGEKLVEMPEPTLTPGYEYSYGECTIDGKLRSDLIAEIKNQSNSPISIAVKRVWAADSAHKSFKISSPEHIVCYNADYGF